MMAGPSLSRRSGRRPNSDEGAPPRYATPRNPANRTDGHRVAVVADALGTPFMPWQRLVADVAGERNPDGSYVYPIVVVTVPRQSGKTTLMRAVALERCISTPGLQAFYTAQTGKDAKERWNDLVKQVASSPFKSRAQVRRAAGSERLILPNASEFRCFAPTASSLHGYTPPLVMLDEAFAHDEMTGNDLMGAIEPAQVTLINKQLWIVSTAGTALSGFLNAWIERGRTGTEGVCLMDWGAGPEVADIYDPAAWWDFHPALGFTITEEAIAKAAVSLSRSEFERAFGNRPTITESHVISPDEWGRLTNEQTPPTTGLVLAYDVDYDRMASTITAHWSDADGRPQGRVVASDAGMGWVADAIVEYRAKWNVRKVCAHDDGAAREVTDTLKSKHVPVTTLNGKEFSNAWGALVAHLHNGTAGHDGGALLAQHATTVVTRPMSDASAPSRRNSPGPISALCSFMVGTWVLEHSPADKEPLFRFEKE